MDASLDWFESYLGEHPELDLPMMKDADKAFDAFRLGRAHRSEPPMYIVIDKHGVVRHRSLGQGSISLEEVRDMVAELLGE